jgi:ABC-type phosphate transport system auxiliary subunit
MEIKEQLDIINSIPKTELSAALGISRQALYQKLRSGNIEEIYKEAVKIKKGQTNIIECQEKEILRLKENISNLEFLLEEKNKELAIYKNQEKYKELKENYNELQKKYLNLRARYINQNDELLRTKLELSKERGEINDIKGS